MRRLAAFCLMALLGCSSGRTHTQSDWERTNEGALAREDVDAPTADTLPAFPRNENLTRFSVSPVSDFSFFVDRTSVSVGKDRIVRFVLLARSPSGVDNISYEAINCREAEFRIYAIGRSDGTWLARRGEWRTLRQGAERAESTLFREFFCPGGIPIADASDGVMALERGGHPFVRPKDSVSGAGR